jgi:CopG family nickel-responsive transcriptional regulator
MQRITIVLDDELVAEIDRLAVKRGYQNRSEAIRDLARSGIRQTAEESDTGECVAALVYAYDYAERDLAKRLAKAMHDNHDLSVGALQIPLDHHSRMEVNVLCGDSGEVRKLGEHVIAERGVRHGRLVMLPVELKTETHTHGKKHSHRHVHVKNAG